MRINILVSGGGGENWDDGTSDGTPHVGPIYRKNESYLNSSGWVLSAIEPTLEPYFFTLKGRVW